MVEASKHNLASIPKDVLALIPPAMAGELGILPIAYLPGAGEKTLVVGFSSLELLKSPEVRERLEETAGCRVRLEPIDEKKLIFEISRHYNVLSVNGQAATIDDELSASDGDESDSDVNESAITEVVNAVIRTAVEARASDIHMLPMAAKTEVLFREDGKPFDYSTQFNIDPREYRRFVNKIKTKCEPMLNITQQKVPQDGAFRIVLDKRKIDCRVNTMPSYYGEKLNIRLFDVGGELLSIEALGFPPQDVAMLKKILTRPSGMILVSAPTGHGKSTTIHSMIRTFDPTKQIIIAIEDPVEELLPGVAQVQVQNVTDEKLSLTFAKALRACLRQDPNILAVGEIRDSETAKIAIAASQTGHMFFSTVHARDSISSLARVLEMGVPRGDFLREMVCIISQRLVSLNCPECAVIESPSPESLAFLTEEERETVLRGTPKKGTGCPRCKGRGYYGRMAVPEYIVFNNEVRDFLALDHGIKETIAFLREKHGYIPMWDNGLSLVARGIVSLDEVISIIAPDR